MIVTFSREELSASRADLIAVGISDPLDDDAPSKLKASDGGLKIDTILHGELGRSIKIEKPSTKAGDHKLYFTAGLLPARYVAVVGLGDAKASPYSMIKVGSALAKAASESKAKSVAFVLEEKIFNDMSPAARLKALATGILLGSYRYEKYRSKKKAHEITELIVHTKKTPALSGACEQGMLDAVSTNFARDLSNSPAIDMTPARLADLAKEVSKECGLGCRVFTKAEIEKENMGALLAVGQGSIHPPTFTHIWWKPKSAKKKVALVGKGITFDSGGISIKPSKGLEQMKEDMAGAAAVIAAMKIIGTRKPKVEVHAYIPACENMPGSRAIRPGDIIKSRAGKTIEIISTDAEGRLILADALDYAIAAKPDFVIDVATLTGGASYAVGDLYTAIIGNDQRLVDMITLAGLGCGEKVWQLPLEKEYIGKYKKGIADLRNTGGVSAQTISGAIFLEQFVGKNRWAHLDIAASSWTSEGRVDCPHGATGAMARTLAKFVENLAGR